METEKFKLNVRNEWFSWLAIAIAAIVGWWTYPKLPAQVPSHWGITGEIDGWTSPLGHALGVPAMMLGLYILFLLIPILEPRRDHFHKSLGFYQMIRNFMMAFLLFLFLITTWTATTGQPLRIDVIVPIAVGVLFIFIGNYLHQVKSNFFMGIRTPWTLSSDIVWRKTHHLGGYMFVLGGLLFFTTPLWPTPLNFYIPMVGILLAALVPIVYSYWLFTKEKK
ncbi:SdpI family protein [Patescibacteria group bacterium]|nr:SdpI family protein [Patescibacteria group bacterium]